MTTELGPPRNGVALIKGWLAEGEPADAHLQAVRQTVHIEGRLVARTGVHVGVGLEVDPLAASSRPICRDQVGRPVIPGSTFKGAIRNAVETLLLGAGLGHGIDACDPVETPCLDGRGRGQLGRALGDTPDALALEVMRRSCASCHLFGSPWIRGRARFSDLEPLGTAPVGVRVCRPVSRDRQTASLWWAAEDFEVAPPGSAFAFTITVVNPRPWEIGLIAAALRQLDEGYVTIGGQAGRGLGRVRVAIEGIRSAGALDLLLGRAGEVVGTAAFRARFGAPEASSVDAASDEGAAATDESAGEATPETEGGGEDAAAPDPGSPGGSVAHSPAPDEPKADEPDALHPAFVALREAVVEATRRVGKGQPNHSVVPQFMAAAGWTRQKLIEEGFLTEQRKDWKLFYKKALEAGAVWGDEQTLLVDIPGLEPTESLGAAAETAEVETIGGESEEAFAARARIFGETPDDVRAVLERHRGELETYVRRRQSGEPIG